MGFCRRYCSFSSALYFKSKRKAWSLLAFLIFLVMNLDEFLLKCEQSFGIIRVIFTLKDEKEEGAELRPMKKLETGPLDSLAFD